MILSTAYSTSKAVLSPFAIFKSCIRIAAIYYLGINLIFYSSKVTITINELPFIFNCAIDNEAFSASESYFPFYSVRIVSFRLNY